ncbi:MAG: glutamate racemase [Candidatus Dormibacteria bacterium]
MSDTRPVGVFDSGVGGLTVLRELHRQLPLESTVYLGDLANFPYGPRYQAEVLQFALSIIAHLESLDVKLVVIACNTATAAALDPARERFDIPILGVISPGAEAAVAATRNNRVGVISTEGTLNSQAYLHALREANPAVVVLQRPAPGLVELVEQGRADTPAADEAVAEALAPILDFGADTLVLGCTHYPLLRAAIARVAPGLTVVDSAETTAARVARVLARNRLEAGEATVVRRVQVTADPGRFAEVAAILFGSDLPPIELVPAPAGGAGPALLGAAR